MIADKSYSDDTMAAISTPIGEGGIGIVRLSGPEALKIADGIFISKDGKRPSRFKSYTTHYGYIVDSSQLQAPTGPIGPLGRRPSSPGLSSTQARTGKLPANIIDEVILTVMKAPKSYTKEDIVEINCHGGIRALKEVLELVVKKGARIASPGEFTKRAFLNGRIDLAQAEAVLDVIRAKTDGSLKVAVSQLEGELSKKVKEIRNGIIDITSHIEASIDFPEEDSAILDEADIRKKINGILNELEGLINTSGEGIILREGMLAVICGKPNVGKSSLMNLLLKRDRVIVTPIPGTTRDAVEEMIDLKGIPIRLVDTAGIVATEDIVEKEGVARSKKYLELADLVILMLDGSNPIDSKDTDIIEMVKDKKKLVVINKSDLRQRIDKRALKDLFKEDGAVEISVEKRRNIEILERAILDTIWNGGFAQAEGAIVNNVRHKELLDKAFANMLSVNKALEEAHSPDIVAVDLKGAIFNLGLIIGESVSDDILDRIFENFCIGK